MSPRGRLSPPASTRAVNVIVGQSLVRAGLPKVGTRLYGTRRDDDAWILASIAGGRKEAISGAASSVRLLLGLGRELSIYDLRTSALGSLGVILGSGRACLEMCRVHNVIVSAWKTLGPEASRAATLLSWTDSEVDRNAPEVLWYRDADDLARWARFLEDALPHAVHRLRTASIKPGLLFTFEFAGSAAQ